MKIDLEELVKKRKQLEDLVEVTFFIPCHNEEHGVITTLDKIISIATNLNLIFELLIYDDGSTDNTKDVVENYAKGHPEVLIRIVNKKKRKGLGYNYIDGAFLSLGKYYMMICGDNSETEESIREIFEKKGAADIVIPYFGHLDTRSFFRRNLSRLFTNIVNFINGYNIKYYNGTVLHLKFNIMRWHPTSSGFAYQAELLSTLLGEDKSYVEVHVSNRDRKAGSSKMFNLLNILSITHSLLQIFFRRIRRTIWPP